MPSIKGYTAKHEESVWNNRRCEGLLCGAWRVCPGFVFIPCELWLNFLSHLIDSNIWTDSHSQFSVEES